MLKQIQKTFIECYEYRVKITFFIIWLLIYIILNQAINNNDQDKEIEFLNKPSMWEIYIEWIKDIKSNINKDTRTLEWTKETILFLEWNINRNKDLLKCKIWQLERIVNSLDVTSDFCEKQKIEVSTWVLKEINDKVIIKEIKTQEKSKELGIGIKTVKRVWFSEEKNKQIQYAYKNSWYNRDMILTFLSENDSWELNRPSDKKWFDWNRAYWICQLYRTYHSDFIDSPEFQDPYKQIDYCINEWNRAEDLWILDTTWYAYVFRFNAEKNLKFNW